MKWSRYDLFMLGLFFSAFRMDGLIFLLPQMKLVYGGMQAGMLLISLLLLWTRRYPMKGQLVMLGALFAYPLLITAVRAQSTEQVLSMILSDFTICLGTYVGVRLDVKRFLYRCRQGAAALLAVNLLNMLAMPESLGLTRSSNKIFLLTSDNGLLKYLLVFCVLYELSSCLFYVPLWRKWGFYAVCMLELLIGEAATSFFAFAVYLACILLVRKVAFTRFGTLELLGVLAANWFLLIFRNMELFGKLAGLVGKNTTFSGRTLIWDSAIRLLDGMPFFGYGVTENTYYVIYKNTPMEAHNMILSLLLQGGILLALLWLWQILFVNRRAFRLGRDHAMNYVMIGLLAYGVMFLVESPPIVPGFFMLLVLGGELGTMRLTIPRRKLRVLIHDS